MNIRLKTKKYAQLYGGQDDNADTIEMPVNQMRYIRNFFVKRNGLERRGGYRDRLSEELESGAYFKAIHQWDKTDDSVGDDSELLYFLNSKVIRDDGTTRTDITSGQTLSALADRETLAADYDGRVVITDQVNPVLVWPYDLTDATNKDPDSGGVLVTLNAVIGSDTQFVSAARAVGSAWNHLFLGGITDIDGTYRGNRIIWNRPGRLGVWQTNDFFDFETNDQIVAIVKHAISVEEDVVLVFMRKTIYAIALTKQTAPKFRQFRVSDQTGALSARSIVPTDRGIFFLGPRGVYLFEPGSLSPRFVGKPFNTTWAGINKTMRRRFVGCEVPGTSSVVWHLPSGSSQETNNLGMVLNYEEWHEDGSQEYPAFSYFDGDDSKAFSFSAVAKITESDGTERAIFARLGRVYNFNIGRYDETSTVGIPWGFKTPFYEPAGPGVVCLFYHLLIDATVAASATFTLYQRLFNNQNIQTELEEYLRGSGVPLGVFVLGQDELGISGFGSFGADLEGESRYIEIECVGNPDINDLSVHALTFYFDPIGTQNPYN